MTVGVDTCQVKGTLFWALMSTPFFKDSSMAVVHFLITVACFLVALYTFELLVQTGAAFLVNFQSSGTRPGKVLVNWILSACLVNNKDQFYC